MVTVRNSILASTASGSCAEDAGGTIAPAVPGHNIDAGTTCGFLNTDGNMSGTDPMMSSGQAGNPLHTVYIIFAGSPAIDNADPTCGGGLTLDHRGVARPQGGPGNCDIGAYERDYRDLAVTVTGSGTVTGTGISCTSGGGDCDERFLDGGPGPVLTATPSAGFQFASWSGGACASITGNQCTIDTGNSRMVTAAFSAIPSSGGGGGGGTTTQPTTPKKCKKGQKLKQGKCVKRKKKRKK